MGYYSIVPYFIEMTIFVLIAATPLFKAADTPPIATKSRVTTLDGLRGFLALSVFFHHSSIYHGFLDNGVWVIPPSRFYTMAGQVGVSLFFMITGYLFWSQIIRSKGKPNIVSLYIGRVFRIGPLYLAALAFMMATVFMKSGLHLRVSPVLLVVQLLKWSSLGLTMGGDVNGVKHAGAILAYVTWSLHYEWLFYISLFFTRFFGRNRLTHLLFPIFGLVASIPVLFWAETHGKDLRELAFIALFCFGMLTASLKAILPNINTKGHIFSILVLADLALTVSVCDTAYGSLAVCLLAPAFFMITNGATVFGLLTSTPAKRLGDVSFGIYLLQGLALAAVFSIGPLRAFALQAPVNHWLLVMVGGILLISIATVAHVFVERRGVDLGKLVLKSMGADTKPLAPRPVGLPQGVT